MNFQIYILKDSNLNNNVPCIEYSVASMYSAARLCVNLLTKTEILMGNKFELEAETS